MRHLRWYVGFTLKTVFLLVSHRVLPSLLLSRLPRSQQMQEWLCYQVEQSDVFQRRSLPASNRSVKKWVLKNRVILESKLVFLVSAFNSVEKFENQSSEYNLTAQICYRKLAIIVKDLSLQKDDYLYNNIYFHLMQFCNFES